MLSSFFAAIPVIILAIANGIDNIGINTYTSTYVPEACKNCPKHPTNGGDGICHCILGGLEIKY